MITIRNECASDYDQIRKINDLAFEQPEEGQIIEMLRKNCDDILSLVAVSDETVVGHILFSPAIVNCEGKDIKGMGLAPMAVLPDYQKDGIGSMLVKEGLKIIEKKSYPFVIVLGHENYYPRFGFELASKYNLQSQWEGVPDEAFMAIILDESAMAGISGVAKYRDEFDAAM